MNKKGVSQVVTTLIILLVVIVAVGIVAAVIYNMTSKGEEQLEGSMDCFNVQLGIDSAVLNGANYDVIVSRGADNNPEAITEVKLIFGNSTHTGTVTKTVSVNSLGKQVVPVTVVSLTEVSAPTSVKVSAVIGDQTCNPVGERTID